MLICFVDDREAKVCSQNENGKCTEYHFYLDTRCMTVEPSGTERSLRSDALARNYFDNLVGTPEKLMEFAKEGRLSKLELANLLLPEKKNVYLDTCADLEKSMTEACAAKGDTCLEDGCAPEGETCLNAILEAGEAYINALASMWVLLFMEQENRIEKWRT